MVNGEPVPNLWAVGDVTGKLMLAHTAAAQGTIAVENILGNLRTIDYRSIPAATFTHPEISSVGLTEETQRNLHLRRALSWELYAAISKLIRRLWQN